MKKQTNSFLEKSANGIKLYNETHNKLISVKAPLDKKDTGFVVIAANSSSNAITSEQTEALKLLLAYNYESHIYLLGVFFKEIREITTSFKSEILVEHVSDFKERINIINQIYEAHCINDCQLKPEKFDEFISRFNSEQEKLLLFLNQLREQKQWMKKKGEMESAKNRWMVTTLIGIAALAVTGLGIIIKISARPNQNDDVKNKALQINDTTKRVKR